MAQSQELSQDAFDREVFSHVKKAGKEGVRNDQIAAAMGSTCRDVGAALRNLRDEGKAKSTGNTRGTRWFVK